MKRKISAFCTAILLVLTFPVTSQTYRNPIFGGDYPDPTIVRDGAD